MGRLLWCAAGRRSECERAARRERVRNFKAKFRFPHMWRLYCQQSNFRSSLNLNALLCLKYMRKSDITHVWLWTVLVCGRLSVSHWAIWCKCEHESVRVQLLYFYMVFIVIQLFSSFNKKAGVHAWECLSLSEEEMGSFLFSSEIKYWFLLSVGTATSSGRLAPKQGHLLS